MLVSLIEALDAGRRAGLHQPPATDARSRCSIPDAAVSSDQRP
jgi:hypothetical protein